MWLHHRFHHEYCDKIFIYIVPNKIIVRNLIGILPLCDDKAIVLHNKGKGTRTSLQIAMSGLVLKMLFLNEQQTFYHYLLFTCLYGNI